MYTERLTRRHHRKDCAILRIAHGPTKTAHPHMCFVGSSFFLLPGHRYRDVSLSEDMAVLPDGFEERSRRTPHPPWTQLTLFSLFCNGTNTQRSPTVTTWRYTVIAFGRESSSIPITYELIYAYVWFFDALMSRSLPQQRYSSDRSISF
jgi:hypothetical protein